MYLYEFFKGTKDILQQNNVNNKYEKHREKNLKQIAKKLKIYILLTVTVFYFLSNHVCDRIFLVWMEVWEMCQV